MFLNHIEAQDASNDYIFEMTFTQIYGFWQYSFSNWLQMIYRLQIGDLMLIKAGIGVDDEKLDGIQGKLGIGILMSEKENYDFFVNTTWDIDDFTEGQWDGGNIQAQFYY